MGKIKRSERAQRASEMTSLTDAELQDVTGGSSYSGDVGHCQIEINFPTRLDPARLSAAGIGAIGDVQGMPEIWVPRLS